MYATRSSLNMRTAAVLFRWSWYSSRSASTESTSKTVPKPSARSASSPAEGCGSPWRTPTTGHGLRQSACCPLAALTRSGPEEGPTVDPEGLTGEEPTRVGAEEERDGSDVELRVAVAAGWAGGHERLVVLRPDGAGRCSRGG